jgi:hypothetical protein
VVRCFTVISCCCWICLCSSITDCCRCFLYRVCSSMVSFVFFSDSLRPRAATYLSCSTSERSV